MLSCLLNIFKRETALHTVIIIYEIQSNLENIKPNLKHCIEIQSMLERLSTFPIKN